MKPFIALVKKECLHVIRDRRTLLILVGMPVVQMLIFGFALSNEIKDCNIMIVDQAGDPASQQLIKEIDANPYFQLAKYSHLQPSIEPTLKKGDIQIALVIPAKFDQQLQSGSTANLQIITNATDPNTATSLRHYLQRIIHNFISSYITNNAAQAVTNTSTSYQINVHPKMLYNPQLKGAPNFVPGVMALVQMLICVLMTAVSIVKEKETGTMEVLLVSPFKPGRIILAKAVPYFILSLLNVLTILLLSVVVLDLPVKGSLLLLLLESMLFILSCLTIGIFISIKTHSQQTAMLISLMGMLLPTILFSGFMFPIENMPVALQWFSNIIPAKWYYIIVKDIMIKGLGIASVWQETLTLVVITAVFTIISLKSFKVRLT